MDIEVQDILLFLSIITSLSNDFNLSDFTFFPNAPMHSTSTVELEKEMNEKSDNS